MNIKDYQLNQIKPYEKNPRKHNEAVKYIAKSIQEFGFKVPIIIDKNNTIVCGEARYKAAKQLKLQTVPCVLADDLTEEQIKAFRLVDNKVAEYSEWDFDLLSEELEGLVDFDMSGFGFDELFAEEEGEEVEEDGFDPDDVADEEPITKRGEIYQLGNHRLMVGDSTKEEDVNALMDGAVADLVVTDPPYNVNVSNTKGMKIENDNMSSSAFLDFLTSCFKNLTSNLKAGGAFYVWLASKEWINFETALNENGLHVRQELIWNKNQANLSRSDYHWKHEPCMYGWKEGAAHYFIKDYTQTTVYEDIKPEDIKKMKKDDLVKLLQDIMSDNTPTTVIDEAKPTVNDLHPTMKPIKLIGRLVRNSSRKNEKVLDLFGGSGSALIACEQLDRSAYLMEYDPKYADAIIHRWEQFTGNEAVKIREAA